jgi:filamentous hemagglutinin family protein
MKRCIDRFGMRSIADINKGLISHQPRINCYFPSLGSGSTHVKGLMTHNSATPSEASLTVNGATDANGWCRCWQLGRRLALGISGAITLAGCNAFAFFPNRAFAQNITLDGSLGPAETLTGPNYLIPQAVGQTVGSNLFHSFGQFNLDTGEAAIFQSTADIRNILSRVTGGSASFIDGLISTESSNVNLYLINPSGILFGSNASIAVGDVTRGSFVATTANAIQFGSQGAFMASTSQADVSLLRVNPSALLFNQVAAAPIISQATLRVDEGQSLVLVGGDVQLNGGNLFAPGGRVELGSVADIGSVRLSLNGNDLRLSFPTALRQGDISLDQGTRVNVRAGGGGSIAINAQNLNLTGGSKLEAGIDVRLGSPNSKAGNIEINAAEAINLRDGSSIDNTLQLAARGKGGNINIRTGSLSATNSSLLSASTSGWGDAGNVNIQARSTVSFISSGALSIVNSTGRGNGGNVNITTESLSVTDGGLLGVSTLGRGNAGSVNIRAASTVSFDGVGSNNSSSGAYSRVESIGRGKAGSVNITTGSLSVTNGAQLTASTLKQGDAGNVNIRAASTVSFDGVGSNQASSGASSTVSSTAVGNGGNINIVAGALSVANGAVVAASTSGQGDGGNISLNTTTLEAVNGGQIFTTSRRAGKAGNITINATDSVNLSGSNPALLTRLSQQGGDRVLNAASSSGLFANTTENSTGRGGDIRIKTGRLIVQDRAEVNVTSEGQGNAGVLQVDAASILLDNQGKLTASTTSGAGGNITLQVQDLLLMRRNSLISTESGTSRAGGGGKGGDLRIDSKLIVAVPSENSDIVANAFDGPGGNINITTEGIFGIEFRDRLTPLSDITASSEFGVKGTVQITTLNVDPGRGLTQLPSELVDAEELIDRRCDPNGATVQRSSFTVTGRGGLPPNPGNVLRDEGLLVDWATSDPNSVNQTASATAMPSRSAPRQLVEAQGWIVNQQGQIVLTAQASTATPHSNWLDSAQCNTLPSSKVSQR